MKPKAFVFFDLDGTLLNADSKVDPEVADALVRMKENGAVPFIATGRSPVEIKHILDSTAIDSFISLNGQYVQYEGQEVYRNPIPKEYLERLKQMTDEKELALSFYSSDKIRTTRHTKTIKNAYGFIHEDPPAIDPDFYKKEDIMMCLVVTEDKSLDEEFIEAFPEFSFYRNTPYSIDTILEGHSKATGIDKLVENLRAGDVPLYAFGDGPNDLEMLQKVDVAVAMDNGIDEIKEAADYITSSHTNGGIIEGLKKYDLI
ncbi:Cof-type HAD-IIB family hydrolase [Atopococcus tabaci]|uniref:Cof-type HAD-IIB family hydrolase n=1 Tax=Atopococcus tabaci TaxID=269774 RepID=UPI0024098BF6|nr:Cof-type HAD-IIB family hydrolase [Atopococcus tabaci]